MKPTSVIFLIVSVIVICVGLAACFVATNMAEAEGIALYNQIIDENNNYVFTSDITDKGITKIEIHVSDCEVNIIGNAQTSKIELVNFSEGWYSINVTGKIVTLDETPDIAAMLKFWEGGFKFKGMRHIIRLGSSPSDEGKEKSVNIYLTEDETVKIINSVIKNGSMNVISMHSSTDYNITIDKGSVSLLNSRTASTVSVIGSECNINLSESQIKNLVVENDSGDITSNAYTFSSIIIKQNSGNVQIESAIDLGGINMSLVTKSGDVVFKDLRRMGNYIYENELELKKIDILTDSANINVNQKLTAADSADQFTGWDNDQENITEE